MVLSAIKNLFRNGEAKQAAQAEAQQRAKLLEKIEVVRTNVAVLDKLKSSLSVSSSAGGQDNRFQILLQSQAASLPVIRESIGAGLSLPPVFEENRRYLVLDDDGRLCHLISHGTYAGDVFEMHLMEAVDPSADALNDRPPLQAVTILHVPVKLIGGKHGLLKPSGEVGGKAAIKIDVEKKPAKKTTATPDPGIEEIEEAGLTGVCLKTGLVVKLQGSSSLLTDEQREIISPVNLSTFKKTRETEIAESMAEKNESRSMSVINLITILAKRPAGAVDHLIGEYGFTREHALDVLAILNEDIKQMGKRPPEAWVVSVRERQQAGGEV